MKTIKLFLVTLTLANLVLSCKSNDNPTDRTDQTVEFSDTAKMMTQNLNNKIIASSLAETATDLDRNLEFDYNLNFVYPITLAYNNNTEIQVTGSAQLLSIIEALTDAQYVTKIGFPFEAQTADGTMRTITNEPEFKSLVDSADADGDGIPNYSDPDDDNDGVADVNEDTNHDGDATNDDTNGDGTPDYQDANSTNDGNGNDDGNGNGDGNGNDDGNGNGDGNGNDDGNGNGDGNGNDDGNGNGDGNDGDNG